MYTPTSLPPPPEPAPIVDPVAAKLLGADGLVGASKKSGDEEEEEEEAPEEDEEEEDEEAKKPVWCFVFSISLLLFVRNCLHIH